MEAPFKVGQKVVCVDAVGTLVKDRVYEVLSLKECQNCNEWYVGHTPTPEKNPNDRWPCCFKRADNSDGFRYARASRFAPLHHYADQTSSIAKGVVIGDEVDGKKITVKPMVNN